MAGIIKVPVVQISGGYYAPDNSIADPKIKHLGSGTFYDGTLIGSTGVYKFLNGGTGCPDGYYVFYDGATAKDNVLGSVAEGGTWFGDGSLGYLALVGSDYDADSKKIINVADPTTATGALNRQTGDVRYILASVLASLMDLTSNQTASGTKTFNIIKATQLGQNLSAAGWEINGLVDPTVGSAAARKAYVDDAIDTAVSAIVITPYQESPNVIRCIPGGAEKTGQVYTTYANSLQYALAVAGVDHRMTIKFEGMGTAGYNYINMSNAGGDYIDDYIHFKAINQDILLIPPATDVIRVGALGNSIIENFTIYKDDSGVDVEFENIVFINCSFNLTVLTATFTNCRFKNCDIIVNDDGDGTATFTNCKGRADSNQSFGTSTIDGQQNKHKLDF